MIIVELLLLAYFIYVVGYTFIFAIGGLTYRLPTSRSETKRTFCVLLPSYKEDSVIIDSARNALEQDYPLELFQVVVIADQLQPETLATLAQLPITVVPVYFETSTKVKALNHALASVSGNFDYAIILDADNNMVPGFLQMANNALNANCRVLQGERRPKNQNNDLSLLDGVSEAINNHIYRKGTVALGLSSSIAGSGIVFEFELLKRKLAPMTSIGGYDREMEILLLEEGIKVGYHEQMAVLDEKVSNRQAFDNQRRRWIYSQYFYLAKYFKKGMIRLAQGDLAYFNSAVLRNIQLPRLINIGLITLVTLLAVVLRNYLHFDFRWWIVLFLLNTIAILFSIPRAMYTRRLLIAVLKLPGLFWRLFKVMFKLKGANKKFIHTPHGTTTS